MYSQDDFMRLLDDIRDLPIESALNHVEDWIRTIYKPLHEHESFTIGDYQHDWFLDRLICSPREILELHFREVLPRKALDDLERALSADSQEWLQFGVLDDYDRFEGGLIDDISRISDFYSHFTDCVLDVEKLLEVNVGEEISNNFYRLLYANVITALETYLSDAFIHTINSNRVYFKKFVETFSDFNSKKFLVSEIFDKFESLDGEVNKALAKIVWHNLGKVSKLYGDALGVEIPARSPPLEKAINIRHDIVHRNGRTRGGEEILITKSDVSELIANVETFAQIVDEQLPS